MGVKRFPGVYTTTASDQTFTGAGISNPQGSILFPVPPSPPPPPTTISGTFTLGPNTFTFIGMPLNHHLIGVTTGGSLFDIGLLTGSYVATSGPTAQSIDFELLVASNLADATAYYFGPGNPTKPVLDVYHFTTAGHNGLYVQYDNTVGTFYMWFAADGSNGAPVYGNQVIDFSKPATMQNESTNLPVVISPVFP
jgi:hypothetical protein